MIRTRPAYFPESRVASDGEWVSPVSYADDAPVVVPNDATAGFVPRGGESPWIIPNPSDEQGLGRSPGQQWPGRVHAETFNFDQLGVMPFENEQTGGFPDGLLGRNGEVLYGETGRMNPTVQGWSTPVYYEEYEGAGFDPGVASLEDPVHVAYTIGLPAVEDHQ